MTKQSRICRTATLAFSTLLVSLCSSSCLPEPSKRTLTIEEERQLQRQAEHVYSLPQDQQGMGLRQVECNREVLEERGWHLSEHLLDALSDSKTACEPVMKPTPDVMKSSRGSIDAVIDKNLKDALDNSKR